jgi:hypothetical protein
MSKNPLNTLAKYDDLQAWAPENISKLLAFATFACFVVYALFAFVHGTMETSDGDRDAGYALNLIGVGFNPIAYLETVDMPQPSIQYLIYIYILAFCHLLGGEHWLIVLTVIDVVAYGTAAYLILTIAVRAAITHPRLLDAHGTNAGLNVALGK